MKVTEGFIPFLNYRTYYRIVGEKNEEKAPLLLLHGGPGSSHNYFELLDLLAKDHRQIIMYDQLGCGQSSIPEDTSLYNKDIWIQELVNLRNELSLDQVHILGQSWGGMLAIIYACDFKPK